MSARMSRQEHTESRIKECTQDSMDLSTPLGPLTAEDTARCPGAVGVSLSPHHTFDVLLPTDLFITRLRCVEPCVSEPVPLAPRSDS